MDKLFYNSLYKLKNKIHSTKKVFLETYGCQMNVSDSEIVLSILLKNGYELTENFNEAILILINTCSIREKAEQSIRNRLAFFKSLKKKNKNIKIGLLGCMAERLKEKFLEEEKLLDLIVGPDAYKDLPNLLKEVENNRNAVNIMLSKTETYADISPVRYLSNGISAFVTITRGCDNMCSFCVVPFTRGRERSRNPNFILDECSDLINHNYKEIILLGQNVDSYLWFGGGAKKDFLKKKYPDKKLIYFSDLLVMIAKRFPNLRIRFSTSNPQDMSLKVFHAMKKYSNICKHLHLPVQSGSNKILKKMNRQYTREQYIEIIKKARKIVPNISFSHDIITGFCGETYDDHLDTLSLMKEVKYDFGYMFMYSDRPGTFAHKKFIDDIDQETKKRRLKEIITLQNELSKNRMKTYIGNHFEVLIEGNSKKNINFWHGRTSQNTNVVFPKIGTEKIGDFVKIQVNDYVNFTLIGEKI